ncbi:MAG: hypothetical protein J1F31_02535 [Erysipelotrichales bacterium]|nr:hypothetical protein [Erysipelotrichales bacterium]
MYEEKPQDEGSVGLGIVLGIFITWVGIIIAYVLKQPKTIKGSWIGLLIRYGIGLLGTIFSIILYLAFGVAYFSFLFPFLS